MATTEVNYEGKEFLWFIFLYRKCNKNFNSITAPVTGCLKKGVFEWTKGTQRAFEEIKQKLCKALVLTLQNLDDLFEVECDVVE